MSDRLRMADGGWRISDKVKGSRLVVGVFCRIIRNRQSAGRNHPAFTLVEVLVAAAVLAVGISAAVRTLGAMTRSSAAAADRETAVRLAGQRLATLEAVEGVTAGDSQGQFEEEPRFQWQQRLTGASEAGVLEVTVTVLWQDGAIQRHYDVTTYMLDPNQSSAAGSTTGGTSGAGGGNGGGR